MQYNDLYLNFITQIQAYAQNFNNMQLSGFMNVSMPNYTSSNMPDIFCKDTSFEQYQSMPNGLFGTPMGVSPAALNPFKVNTCIANSIQNNNMDVFERTTSNTNLSLKRVSSNNSSSLVSNAKSYIGKVNSDKEGNRIFSNGKSQAWCADFVSYNLIKTYGNKLPNFHHSSSVNGLIEWGRKQNCYRPVPSGNRMLYIVQNVHPGDIMIEKNNKSHTGIVTAVYPDGSFTVVEGNSDDRVQEKTYPPNSKTLSGFISMQKFKN